jgi:hypothetical protein
MAIDHKDELDFFAPAEVQRTLFQEDVCRPGWVEGMPLPAAPSLYTPNEPGPVPGGPGDDEYRRKAAESIASMRKRGA